MGEARHGGAGEEGFWVVNRTNKYEKGDARSVPFFLVLLVFNDRSDMFPFKKETYSNIFSFKRTKSSLARLALLPSTYRLLAESLIIME